MNYRKMGNTNEMISLLGFGCMRLPEYEQEGKWFIDEAKAIAMLQMAYQQGVNYFDSAPYYCHSNSEIVLGKALKEYREKVFLSTKLPLNEVNDKSDFWRLLKKSLLRLDTDYFDFYHFWALNRQTFHNKVLKYNLIEEALEAKKQGLIKHLSFSFHDEPEVIKEIIDQGKHFSSMLVQYNLLDRKNEEMIEYAYKKGLGVVIMGPVGGGRLASPSNSFGQKLTIKTQSTYELAFKFVLSNPYVTCALSGMEDINMVNKNIEVVSDFNCLMKDELETIDEALVNLKKFSDLYCTGCKYCIDCPSNIQIHHLFQLYTYYNVYGLEEYAKIAYDKYYKDNTKGQISNCQECGLCESVCPQKLNIIKELKKVHQVLGEKNA